MANDVFVCVCVCAAQAAADCAIVPMNLFLWKKKMCACFASVRHFNSKQSNV